MELPFAKIAINANTNQKRNGLPMPRIRSLKPEFFKDEDLCVYPPWVRILFQGLWIQADRAGRLEDRPKKLKAEIFPYDNFDIEKGLELLCLPKKYSPKHEPFILRYEANEEKYIQILKFLRHQVPHHTEKESLFPTPPVNIFDKESRSTPGVIQEHSGGWQSAHEQGTMNLSHKSDPLKKEPIQIDINLTQLLIDLMIKNNPNSSIIKRLTPKRQEEWIDQCRLLREADGKTPEEIERVIAFSQTDDFWKMNILSMPKLREKWDQLWLKAQRGDPMRGIKDWLAKKEKENDGK